MKTKIKSCSDKATDFLYKEMPKVGFNYICLAVILILIEFVLKKDKNYYPQMFFKKCKYIKKEEKVINILPMS